MFAQRDFSHTPRSVKVSKVCVSLDNSKFTYIRKRYTMFLIPDVNTRIEDGHGTRAPSRCWGKLTTLMKYFLQNNLEDLFSRMYYNDGNSLFRVPCAVCTGCGSLLYDARASYTPCRFLVVFFCRLATGIHIRTRVHMVEVYIGTIKRDEAKPIWIIHGTKRPQEIVYDGVCVSVMKRMHTSQLKHWPNTLRPLRSMAWWW